MDQYLSIIKQMDKKISLIGDEELKIKLKRLTKELNKSVHTIYDKAIKDSKTGLYNNHFLQTVLEMEVDKAKRKEEMLSIYIIDIDFFKKVNDIHGHIIGDELLLRLAKIIKNQTRRSDIPVRFGGEEFVILFPETGLNKAKKFAFRLKAAVKNDEIMRRYHITISGGLTRYKKDDNSETIMKRADRALYQAKNNGRDTFVVIK